MPAVPSAALGSKRKAEADLPSPPTQRRCPVRFNTPSAPCAQPTARWPAEPTSIQNILRENCRARLYVPPIAWTSDHLRLLECRFLLVKARGGRKQPHAPSRDRFHCDSNDLEMENFAIQSQEQKRYDQAIPAATQLRQPSTLAVKKFAVWDILNFCDIRRLDSDRMPFCFDCQPVARVRTDGIFSSHTTSPYLAFITFDTIQRLRRKYVYSPPCKKDNIPVLNVRQKRLRSLEPNDQAKDPYVVAVLIALAQAQRERQKQYFQEQAATGEASNWTWKLDAPTGSGSTPLFAERSSSPDTDVRNKANSFKVHVVAIPGKAAKMLYVYSANIPAEFLDKFDRPSHSSPSCPVDITSCSIRLAHPDALRHLHRRLCVGSCWFCVGRSGRDPRAGCDRLSEPGQPYDP